MNKKAIVILGAIFLLIVGTLGFLVYSRYSSNEEQNPPPANSEPIPEDPNANGGNTNPPTTTPEQAEKLVRLTLSEQVISPILFYNGNGVTYLNQSGQLIKADFEALANGQIQLTRTRDLGIASKSNITKILWPKNGDDFIAEISASTGSGFSSGRGFSYFNFATGAYIDLPEQVKALEWMPSGDKILFIWVDKDAEGNEKATLNMADPDTKNYQQIAELYEADDVLHLSPDGMNLVFHRTQNTESVNKIIQTTPQGTIWKDLVKEGFNYGILWSPDSQKFLFSKKERNSQKYQLWYYDLLTGEVKNLGLFSTVDKAVWAGDSKTVYAAVPTSGSAGEGALTIDSFYKIDTATLEKKEYQAYASDLDGRDLFLNSAGDKLFFRNAQDGGLYYLDLNQ